MDVHGIRQDYSVSKSSQRRQLIGNKLVFDWIESATIQDSDLMPTYGHLSRRTTDKKAGLGEGAHYFDKPGGLNGRRECASNVDPTTAIMSTNIGSPQQG